MADINVRMGKVKEFTLEVCESKYVDPALKPYFSDDFATEFQPQLFNYKGEGSKPEPAGIYYRIILAPDLGLFCIQYYVYWKRQDCGPLKSHIHDYEPIMMFLRPPKEKPVRVVNGGVGDMSSGNLTFHRAEIHLAGKKTRDSKDLFKKFRTSPAPYYPWGENTGREIGSWYKRYPLETSLYFRGGSPLVGILNCYHAFSCAAEAVERRKRLSPRLNRMDDTVLGEWYHKHYESETEEPFGHDVSNPFDFPHIKYSDPKGILKPLQTSLRGPD